MFKTVSNTNCKLDGFSKFCTAKLYVAKTNLTSLNTHMFQELKHYAVFVYWAEHDERREKWHSPLSSPRCTT